MTSRQHREGRGIPSRDATDRAAQAYLGISLSALWADGRERPVEVDTTHRELARLAAFEGLDAKAVARLATELRDDYTDVGAQALVERCARDLHEDQTEQAFAIAVDIVLCDREATDEERAFLDELQALLGVDDEEARDTIDVLEGKHGITLEAPESQGEDDEGQGLDLTPEQALVAFALGSAYATKGGANGGDHSPGSGPASVDLPPVRGFLETDPERREALIEAANRGFRFWGMEHYLGVCGRVLEGEQAVQAFTWAADVALADKRLSGPEHAYLTEARVLLGVPPDEAARIVDVLWKKHMR